MSYRPLALAAAVAALSSMHVASAAARSVYVALGGVIAFVGATIHWVVDGHIQSIILDFIKLGIFLLCRTLYADSHISRAFKAHTGAYLASHVSECLHEYGIHRKVCQVYPGP